MIWTTSLGLSSRRICGVFSVHTSLYFVLRFRRVTTLDQKPTAQGAGQAERGLVPPGAGATAPSQQLVCRAVLKSLLVSLYGVGTARQGSTGGF